MDYIVVISCVCNVSLLESFSRVIYNHLFFRDALEKPDVNCMLYSKTDNQLYAGCGDNRIYVFGLEDGRLIRTMEGHDDYIHSIHNM
jgi:hypothetical protein